MTVSEDEAKIFAKRELRQRMLKMRASLPVAAAAARSRVICERLTALLRTRTVRAAAVFAPMLERREVDVRPVVAQLREMGVRVAYPRVGSYAEFAFVSDDAALVRGAFGDLGAGTDCPVAHALDVMLVPGLAFTEQGDRLGYGRGYYDRLIRKHPEALTLGVAYAFQLLAELPTFDHDARVSKVVTDGEPRSYASDEMTWQRREEGVVVVPRPHRR